MRSSSNQVQPADGTQDLPGTRHLPRDTEELVERRRTLPAVDPEALRRDLAAASDDRVLPLAP